MTYDSTQHSSDTMWSKVYWHATGEQRAADDTLDKVEFLDTEDRLINTDTLDYPFTGADAIKEPFVVRLNRDRETP